MKKQNVYDPLISKRQQYLLATQLVRAVLKIGELLLSLVALFVIIWLIYLFHFLSQTMSLLRASTTSKIPKIVEIDSSDII